MKEQMLDTEIYNELKDLLRKNNTISITQASEHLKISPEILYNRLKNMANIDIRVSELLKVIVK